MRYVVEQTLAGQGDRLKGYTIAVEVFGRPADFDAQSDPLVRVEAGRLRRRLVEYYADEGRGDPVRLELPRGSYSVAASYASRAAVAAQPPAENAATRNRRRWRRIRTIAVVATLAAGVAVILWQRREVERLAHDTPPASVVALSGRPPLVITPFEVLGGDAAAAEVAATLREEVFLVLDGPSALVVPTDASGDAAPSSGYVLTGSVRESDGAVRITARLVRADTGMQLWSAAYDEPLAALRSPAGQRRVARLLAVAAEPYGPVFEAELQRLRTETAHTERITDCQLRYYEYRRQFGALQHAQAAECFERVAQREPEVAEAWAGLALLSADAWAHGFAGRGGSAPVLEKAREAARHAMDLDGKNLHANLALAGVQFLSGNDYRDVLERVLATWPENAEARAYLGAMLILSGDTARGSSLLEQAIEWTPQVPSGYYASRALAALRERRYDDALASALRIDSRDWGMGQLIVAAACALAGRGDLATRARSRLAEIDPNAASALQELLRRWRVEPALAAELERGFAASAP